MAVLAAALLAAPGASRADDNHPSIQSPDGRNSIELDVPGDGGLVTFTIRRDGKPLVGPSPMGPILATEGTLGKGSRLVEVQRGEIDETFELPWGKTKTVHNRCSKAVFLLAAPNGVRWDVELRAFDDGVAFRYRLPVQEGLKRVEIRDEDTLFDIQGESTALFNTLPGFVSNHESLYERKPLAKIPVAKLIEMPVLLEWPNGPAASITEARVRHFAGMYLQRSKADSTTLRGRLSPQLSNKDVCFSGYAPIESPWRVVLLGDSAGKLLESNLLLCLNDAPHLDFSWAKPGKTAFHWWNGEFESDFKLPPEKLQEVFLERHRK